MTSNRPTNGDIYKLTNDLRKEIKGDIKDVAEQLIALSKIVTDNEIKQAVSSTKIGMLITGITIVVSAVTTILVDRITRKGTL